MKEEKKDSGEELIDIDEKGNKIEKEENKEKNTNKSTYSKYMIILAIIIIILISCYYFFNNKNKNKNKSVFDKITLKNIKLKNRVIFGSITHDIKKIEEVVKNNVSLVITDGAIVGDASTKLKKEGTFMVDNDDCIQELKQLPEIVHKYNSYILLDLVHLGLMSVDKPIYSPSVDKGFYNKEIESIAMTKEDILRVQDLFVQAAIRAKKAGFDGIEIHGGHLTLVSLFSTKKYNRRTDEYGGSDENRARFIVEIIKKIRKAVGNNMIISAKIDSPDEDNGISESQFLYNVKALEQAGLDLISISGTNPIRNNEDLYFYEYSKKIAEILKIPVVCIGGIKKYEQADYVLKNSKIEYIAMSREFLKQPDIIKKWYLNNK